MAGLTSHGPAKMELHSHRELRPTFADWDCPMDPKQFDRLARAFGAEQSRRGVLKVIAGGALGVIAGTPGVGAAGAAARKRGLGVVCSKNADCLSAACLSKDR